MKENEKNWSEGDVEMNQSEEYDQEEEGKKDACFSLFLFLFHACFDQCYHSHSQFLFPLPFCSLLFSCEGLTLIDLIDDGVIFCNEDFDVWVAFPTNRVPHSLSCPKITISIKKRNKKEEKRSTLMAQSKSHSWLIK